ncbi:hypothetical protein PENTCL1PPCAC_4694, partial [Pristionchus entomophagus]
FISGVRYARNCVNLYVKKSKCMRSNNTIIYSIFTIKASLDSLDAAADHHHNNSDDTSHHSSDEDRGEVDVIEKLKTYPGQCVNLPRSLLEVGVLQGKGRYEAGKKNEKSKK